MGVLSAVRTWTTGETETAQQRRARCRNCGQYYDAADDRCPHCDSGNKILGGAPSGQTGR
jgi:uncharacterized OB-fold protein